MKITGYSLYKVPPRWLFLKIETDQGIFGWGEPIVEGKASTVKTCVEELMESLIGKDPRRIEDHWNFMYRSGFYRGGPVIMSAIAGIDQALWDIKGKYFNTPIYDLMGGACRDRMQVYSWIHGDSPQKLAESAQEAVSSGFSYLKMNVTEELHYVDSYSKVDQAISNVAAVRQAVGSNVGIAIDFHGRVHKPMAKTLVKELEVFKPMFYEEPILPEHNEDLREIAHHTHIPLATGERMFSRWDFKELLSQGYIDIIQPDLSHAGGITECKKIASMAEAYDVALAPHCPLGPIALASCLQVDASSYNALIQEQSLGIQYGGSNELLAYLRNPDVFKYHEGFVQIPNGPGLGIEINEDYVIGMDKVGHNWKNPQWRLVDGAVAEW